MPNEEKKSRTLISDMTPDEKQLSVEEMENVQGGKGYYESRSNTARESDTPDPGTLSPAAGPTPLTGGTPTGSSPSNPTPAVPKSPTPLKV